MSSETAAVDGDEHTAALQNKIVRLAKALELLMLEMKSEQFARRALEEQVLLTQARVDELEDALEQVEDRVKQYERDGPPKSQAASSRPFFDRGVATLPVSTPSKAKALYNPERVKKPADPAKVEPKRVRGEMVKMEGMLSKKGGKRNRAWKTRRFMLLESGIVLYYKTGEKEGDELMGEIHLKDCSSAEYMREKKYFGFALTTAERVYHLRAPTEVCVACNIPPGADSMVNWMKEILSIMKTIQQSTKRETPGGDHIEIPQPSSGTPSPMHTRSSSDGLKAKASTNGPEVIPSAKEKPEKKSRFGGGKKKEKPAWTPETTPDTIHYGPLQVLEGKKWKMQYFMVEYEKFHIFKSPKDEKPIETLDIYGSFIKTAEPVQEKNKETRHSFLLQLKGKRSIQLSAFSKDDVDYWIECLGKGSKPRTRLL